MAEPALVIIARAPELGRVKTRLAAGIGEARALQVYHQLLAVVTAAQAAWSGPVLLTTGGEDAAWQGTGLAHLPRQAQAAGGLGSRIAAALQWGIDTAGCAIAIGTDCPGLRHPHLQRLATLLTTAPVIFGPARDGGYWGVAVSDQRAIAVIADDAMPWSTPEILRVSRQRLDGAGIAHASGDTLADCDDADDLAAAMTAGFLSWPSSLEVRS